MLGDEIVFTAEMMNNKKGDTTFKVCGWCAYRGSGTYRYDCMIDGNCDLLQSYRNSVKFCTPCRVIDLSKADIKRIIESHKREIIEVKNKIKSKTNVIRVLENIDAEDKPILPENRGDYFNEGDKVYVYHEKKWNKGVVVPGYRSHDGCVSYVLDSYPESSKKGPWGCGWSVPGIIHEWEYKYFQKNIDEFQKWLEKSDRDYNGERLDMKSYFDALKSSMGKK